jgi:hypothetical protein
VRTLLGFEGGAWSRELLHIKSVDSCVVLSQQSNTLSSTRAIVPELGNSP